MTSPDEDTVLDFVPPLITLLVAAERAKGSPLTEPEVIEIRDTAACMAVPASIARAMADSRGYDDLDPDRVWEQWQERRGETGRT